MIVSTALLCLSANVYFESRNQPVPGQYAVALVTMNRAGGDRKKVCREVFKPHQFSWTRGVKRTKQGWQLPARMTPKEEAAWALAQRVAAWTLAGRMPDFTRGSTFFHTHAVKPAWRHAMRPTKRIGAHQFYALADQSALTR